MKIQGKELKLRGSNHKYDKLDDLDALYELLKTMSIGKAAAHLSVPQNSIRYRVMRFFPPEWLAEIKKDRKYHKNNTAE